MHVHVSVFQKGLLEIGDWGVYIPEMDLMNVTRADELGKSGADIFPVSVRSRHLGPCAHAEENG